jgi:hypothetical protein
MTLKATTRRAYWRHILCTLSWIQSYNHPSYRDAGVRIPRGVLQRAELSEKALRRLFAEYETEFEL